MPRGRDRGIGSAMSRRDFGRLSLGAGLAGAAASTFGMRSSPSGPTPADVGLVLSHEQFRTSELVQFAVAAEHAGFGYVWASDHLQPWQDNQGHSMSPWLTLALVCDRTHDIRVGSGVTCPTYRYHPSVVAQAFASLEILAPGRTFLGVGTGESVNEQAGTGEYGPYRERHDRLIEAITLIRRLWSGERTTFDGAYFRTDQLKLYDLPERPPPIPVAAGGPISVHMAGRCGDGWITQAGSALDPELRSTFEAGARSAGRDPARLPVWAEMFTVVGDQAEVDYGAQLWRFTAAGSDQPNPVAIQQYAEQHAALADVERGWVTGLDPATHIAAIDRLHDAGVVPFVHFAQRRPETAIEFYGSRVLPFLKHRTVGR
ncbi:TAT-translocated FGD2 family F420-dependent dehydrogenase [Rhodococcus sp. LBL1]|nr:TAT-translocated FGD2 family F420-dependent dehydrogenase [Rhodococcus sp. LBL1]MDH6685546.1 TAT-translocated FGD2 family F420-dependent dehydrogenase [Rhodococcus sp. LBL2]